MDAAPPKAVHINTSITCQVIRTCQCGCFISGAHAIWTTIQHGHSFLPLSMTALNLVPWMRQGTQVVVASSSVDTLAYTGERTADHRENSPTHLQAFQYPTRFKCPSLPTQILTQHAGWMAQLSTHHFRTTGRLRRRFKPQLGSCCLGHQSTVVHVNGGSTYSSERSRRSRKQPLRSNRPTRKPQPRGW